MAINDYILGKMAREHTQYPLGFMRVHDVSRTVRVSESDKRDIAAEFISEGCPDNRFCLVVNG
jgi:hypothetical protein